MLPYYTLEEVAHRSGLSQDQVLRLGYAGQLVFSIRRHAPQNYKEVDETRHDDGSRTVRTRTSETQIIASSEGSALRLSYISPEDVINVVVNEAPNRKTLVRATFKTRELDPKQGTWQFNSPIEVTTADLVVSAEEWELFSRGAGKNLKAQTPLVLPERVTIHWLMKNLTVGQWVAAATLLASVFGAGLYVARTTGFQQLLELTKPAPSAAQRGLTPRSS